MFHTIRRIFRMRKTLLTKLKELEDEQAETERLKNKHRLKLCYKHRQEQNHSHYSPKNCDYCKLLQQSNQEEISE